MRQSNLQTRIMCTKKQKMNEKAQQNIYDNEIFFEGYKKIRDNKINANNLFEIPALFSMIPDLKGKRVLDLSLIIHKSISV